MSLLDEEALSEMFREKGALGNQILKIMLCQLRTKQANTFREKIKIALDSLLQTCETQNYVVDKANTEKICLNHLHDTIEKLVREEAEKYKELNFTQQEINAFVTKKKAVKGCQPCFSIKMLFFENFLVIA